MFQPDVGVFDFSQHGRRNVRKRVSITIVQLRLVLLSESRPVNIFVRKIAVAAIHFIEENPKAVGRLQLLNRDVLDV